VIGVRGVQARVLWQVLDASVQDTGQMVTKEVEGMRKGLITKFGSRLGVSVGWVIAVIGVAVYSLRMPKNLLT